LLYDILEQERQFKKRLEDSLGIIGRVPSLINPDWTYNEEEKE